MGLAVVGGVIGAAAGVWLLDAMAINTHIDGDVSRGPLKPFFAWDVSPAAAVVLYGLTGRLAGLALGPIVGAVATRQDVSS